MTDKNGSHWIRLGESLDKNGLGAVGIQALGSHLFSELANSQRCRSRYHRALKERNSSISGHKRA